jgi:hypothetical protein
MKNYFINNKEGILNQNKYFNLGCSTEAQVSHFKSLFGNGKKGFVKHNFNKIMILAEAKINGFNLIDYIIKTDQRKLIKFLFILIKI